MISRLFNGAVTLVAAVVMACVLTPGTAAYAQDEYTDYLELVRSDIKTRKVAIITEVMQFTEEESTVFWPIYREYELELSKLGDARVAMIKEYAEHYENLTDEKAKELAQRFFKLQEDRTKLRKKYFNTVEKAMSSITAAQFIQLENQIGLLIDLQIAAELPLIH